MTQVRVIRINDHYEVQSRTKGIIFYDSWSSESTLSKYLKWEKRLRNSDDFILRPEAEKFKKYTDAINAAHEWHRWYNPDIEVCQIL